MKTQSLRVAVVVLIGFPTLLTAQLSREHDVAPLKQWAAPLYWQPTEAKTFDNGSQPEATRRSVQIQVAATPLVFVGMTPCRVVDTRTGPGFAGAFGPPGFPVEPAGRSLSLRARIARFLPPLRRIH